MARRLRTGALEHWTDLVASLPWWATSFCQLQFGSTGRSQAALWRAPQRIWARSLFQPATRSGRSVPDIQ